MQNSDQQATNEVPSRYEQEIPRTREYVCKVATHFRETTRQCQCSAGDLRCKIDEWQQETGIDVSEYLNIGNSNGKTALHLAAQLRSAEVVRLLVELRADVNCTTVRGHTPLIFACGRGKDESVCVLLEAKARCRIRIASGDTAVSFAEERVSPHVLSKLRQAEADESGEWLDFSSDHEAIEAQADHVEQMRRDPYQSQKTIKLSPAVMDVLAKRQQHKSIDSLPAAARESLAHDLSGQIFDVLSSRDAVALAKLLLGTSQSLRRKQAADRIREALSLATEDCTQDNFIVLVRCLSVAIHEVALVQTETANTVEERKAIKQAKITVTSALLLILKERRVAARIALADLSQEAPAWILVELWNPPVGLDLVQDGPALQQVICDLCNENAWGSDFGKALRWLQALRPASNAVNSTCEGEYSGADLAPQYAAYEQLVSVYIDVVSAACVHGRSLKKHLRDRDWLEQLGTTLGDEVRDAVKALLPQSETNVCTSTISQPKVPDGVPFLELPDTLSIAWVVDASTWALLEHRLLQAPLLAMDTEWYGTGKGPALIQIAIGNSLQDASCFLLDMLNASVRLMAADGLRRLFSRSDVKILGWSFDEDRKRLWEVMQDVSCISAGTVAGIDASTDLAASMPPLPICDLQVPCARQLGFPGSSPGLSLACFGLLGHPVDKTEQCSDWRRRPLTDSQRKYAAMDAAVLLQLHEALLQRGELLVQPEASGSAPKAP